MPRLFAAAIVLMLAGGIRPASAQKCGEPFEVAANTPKPVIARMVVDQMFDDIVISDTQQTKAVVIVTKQMDDLSKLDRTAADYGERMKAVRERMKSDLMALLLKETDKAKLAACFKRMDRPRGGRGTP